MGFENQGIKTFKVAKSKVHSAREMSEDRITMLNNTTVTDSKTFIDLQSKNTKSNWASCTQSPNLSGEFKQTAESPTARFCQAQAQAAAPTTNPKLFQPPLNSSGNVLEDQEITKEDEENDMRFFQEELNSIKYMVDKPVFKTIKEEPKDKLMD